MAPFGFEANKRAAARTVSGATPVSSNTCSGEFTGSRMNSFHALKPSLSQRSAMNCLFSRPSAMMTCASALTTATFVLGRSCKW